MDDLCVKRLPLSPDALQMAALADLLADERMVRCPAYRTTFLGTRTDGRERLIGGAGRRLGLRVFVSKKGVTGKLDYCGEVIHTEAGKGGPYETIPFGEVFRMANTLRSRLWEEMERRYARLAAEALSELPLAGGLRSIVLSEEDQEIINYALPEILLWTDGDGLSLASSLQAAEQVTEMLGRIMAQAAGSETRQSARQMSGLPDREEYRRRMEKVLALLRSDQLQKVVIARTTHIDPPEDFDLAAYRAYLYHHFYQEYFYAFAQGEDALWMGISPEIIAKQNGRIAVTKPLAGTRRKYDDEALNEQMRRELRSTDKDITEHDHALRFMVEQLRGSGIGEVRVVGNKELLETPYAFHIKSEISVDLKPEVTCFDVMAAIYPPATVWGIPVDRTEKVIAGAEPFAREYFTGLYGWWDYQGNADTALVIRTAKVDRDGVQLYAGGGIVSASDIDSEFDETENKMRPLRSWFETDRT